MIVNKVLITGADGFVGYWVTKKFVEMGWEVYASVNSLLLKRISDIVPEERIILGDKILNTLLPPIDLVINLAWNGTSGFLRNDFKHQIQNAIDEVEFMKYCKTMGVKRFVGVGSIMEKELEYVIHSDVAPCPAYCYAVGKQLAHNLGKIESAKYNDFDFMWVMITNAYGPGEFSKRLVNTTIRKLLNGVQPEFSAGTQNYDFLYVEDVAEAIYLTGVNGKSMNEYMIGSGEAQQLKKFLGGLCNIINPVIKPIFGNIPFNGVNMPIDVFDNSKLINDTGWKPKTSWNEGIKLTMEWMLKNDY